MERQLQRLRNVMSGLNHPARELRHDVRALDNSCRQRWGVNALMFKTVKFIFYIAVLAFSTFLIETTAVSATLVLLFTALLISGPEGVEMLLIRQETIDDPNSDE